MKVKTHLISTINSIQITITLIYKLIRYHFKYELFKFLNEMM
jgi:hypothetical protein